MPNVDMASAAATLMVLKRVFIVCLRRGQAEYGDFDWVLVSIENNTQTRLR